MAGAQPDWQSPDDGVPVAPEPREYAAPAPVPYERPTERPSADYRNNGSAGESHAERTQAAEPSRREPAPQAPAAPAASEASQPKRKGWWQRLTQ